MFNIYNNNKPIYNLKRAFDNTVHTRNTVVALHSGNVGEPKKIIHIKK
jgi:hypothetical protein